LGSHTYSSRVRIVHSMALRRTLLTDTDRILLYVLIMLFGIGLFALLQGYVITLNTSAWTFRGASFVIAVLPILPFLFLISIIVIPIYFIAESAE